MKSDLGDGENHNLKFSIDNPIGLKFIIKKIETDKIV